MYIYIYMYLYVWSCDDFRIYRPSSEFRWVVVSHHFFAGCRHQSKSSLLPRRKNLDQEVQLN